LGEKGKILIEVPVTGFESIWEKILQKNIRKEFKQQGLGRKQVDIAVKDYIKSMREFWYSRKGT